MQKLLQSFHELERQQLKVAALKGMTQRRKKSLRSHIDSFTQVVVEVKGVDDGLKCWIFENGLLRDNPFKHKLG